MAVPAQTFWKGLQRGVHTRTASLFQGEAVVTSNHARAAKVSPCLATSPWEEDQVLSLEAGEDNESVSPLAKDYEDRSVFRAWGTAKRHQLCLLEQMEGKNEVSLQPVSCFHPAPQAEVR